MVRETSSYHHITKSDLREGYVLVLSSGIILKYVGDVDILNKGNLLFKVIYSTFATVVWIGMTTRELEQKEVILLRN